MSYHTSIQQFADRIDQLPNLFPSPEVNHFFTQLCHYVQTTIYQGDDETFKSETVKKIRTSCGLAEYEMEKHWTQQLLFAEDIWTKLQAFPYLHNYQLLTELEISLLKSQKPDLHSALFIGSGPLPLSGILMARNWGFQVTLVDRDEVAIDLSRKLIEKLGLQGQIRIIQSDFLDFLPEEKFDVILLASLLFNGENQQAIYQHLKEKMRFDLVLIRSAIGLKQLLYHKLDTAVLQEHLRIILEVHPHNEIINSILLCTHHSS